MCLAWMRNRQEEYKEDMGEVVTHTQSGYVRARDDDEERVDQYGNYFNEINSCTPTRAYIHKTHQVKSVQGYTCRAEAE